MFIDDYNRVVEVIRRVDGYSGMEDVLLEIGWGVDQFECLLARWSGSSLKDFVRSISREYLKDVLLGREGRGEVSPLFGESGAMCVQLEVGAVEGVRNRGAEWKVCFGRVETPFGSAIIAECPKGICFLSFDVGWGSQEWLRFRSSMPSARFVRDDDRVKSLGLRVFEGTKGLCGGRGKLRSGLRVFVVGTPFQTRVWQGLVRIPEGALVSYGELARFVGSPGASRAVGVAVGRNPVAYLVPCHRVVGSMGDIGGYHWGVERKRAILSCECSRHPCG